MREIKFRCWDKRHKEMFYSDHERRLATFFDMFAGECCTEVIMQYTGLKDKNGKEIYECDVIVYKNGKKYAVEYLIDGFGAYDIDGNGNNLSTYARGAVVIGNIYENPELLEVSVND